MKVAIIGTALLSRLLAPFNEPEWEIWGCSPGNRGALPRVTKWFELHGVADIKGQENTPWRDEYFTWLRAQTFPVYMQEPNDLLPQAMVFPRKALLDKFGRLGRIAFTSSISWMIAFAVHSGATEIAIFGVDMSSQEEAYSAQKTGCLIMMFLANQAGITVSVPQESCLATMPPLYGYAEASRMGRRLYVLKLHLQQQIAQTEAEIGQRSAALNHYRGGLDSIEYVRRTFVDGENDAEIDEATEQTIAGLEQGDPGFPFSTAQHSLGSSGVARIPTEIGREFGQFHVAGPSGLMVPRAATGG